MSHAAGMSIVGRRENNEDAFRIREDLGLYLVADGMGGHAGGEIASRLAANTIVKAFENAHDSTRPTGDTAQIMRVRMATAVQLAVDAVEQQAVGDLEEMGTTLAAVLVEGNLALIAHVGDSRVYRLRRGRLECLTKDHSFANECRDELRPSVLPEHFASMITRCIAADSVTMPDLRIETTEPGDVFMICSDGITDVLGNEEMGDLIDDHEVALEAAEALVAAAYDAESYDNITCVIVHAAPRAANVSAA